MMYKKIYMKMYTKFILHFFFQPSDPISFHNEFGFSLVTAIFFLKLN